MAKVKGCTNQNCTVFKKKITSKATEEYCSKCGQPLSYVCKKCYKPIDSKGKYCTVHQAEKDDNAHNAKKVVLKAGGAALSLGILAVTKGKDIAKYLPIGK